MLTKTGQRPVKFLILISTCIFAIFLFSCKKPDVKEIAPENVSSAITSATSTCDSTVCEDCVFQETIENDTTEYSTILGGTYTNPYSIQTMTLAYNHVHGTNIQSVSTTHYYVRFKPQTVGDLNKLDSLDLELYDYPLDRVMIQDGDYWPDAYANLAANEYPWLYTVVEAGFQFPAGINHEVLAPLNIPDDDPALEDEAFSLTGNNECGSTNIAKTKSGQQDFIADPASKTKVQPYYFQNCPDGYYWDNSRGKCLPVPDCGTGYHWDYGLLRCVQDPPPPQNLHPHGMINYKTYTDYGVIPPSAPLKYTRIVARRFFKIDKTYTDANGNFQLSKRFPRKVTIIVKFRTSFASIRQEPKFWGLWKRWFPIRKNIGTYKGNDLQNLNYEFQKGSTSRKMKTRRWLAAVALNTALETKNFLSSNNLIPLPDKLPIYLNPPGSQSETSQYEFIKNSYFDPLLSVYLNWITSDINSMTTSKVTINVAQQLGLVYLWKVHGTSNDGINVYSGYVEAINYVNYQVSYKQIPAYYFPFGNGIPINNYNPGIIAMFQAFAQHLGHTIADRIYGYGESNFVLQGKTWLSGGGVSSSTKYLEGFDPNIGEPSELFKWIPVGIINDLIDNNPDPFPVVDNVSGFTYSDVQAAYYMEPTTMVGFKNALKVIKPAQAAAIDQLFTSYGY
jgi:hypothetical protein